MGVVVKSDELVIFMALEHSISLSRRLFLKVCQPLQQVLFSPSCSVLFIGCHAEFVRLSLQTVLKPPLTSLYLFFDSIPHKYAVAALAGWLLLLLSLHESADVQSLSLSLYVLTTCRQQFTLARVIVLCRIGSEIIRATSTNIVTSTLTHPSKWSHDTYLFDFWRSKERD